MALLRARICRDPFLPRLFTSSAVPPPPPSEPASSDPPSRSPFADIYDRLRSPTSASAAAPRGAASVDDLRRKVLTFAESHPSTSSSAESSPGPSFLDAFSTAASSPPAPNRASPSATRTPLGFSALRDSLNKPGSTAGGLPAPGARKIDLKLSLSQRSRPAGQEAALGRDLGAKGPEFLKQYSYEDLGKRRGGLRPAGAGKDGKELSSNEELGSRLGWMR